MVSTRRNGAREEVNGPPAAASSSPAASQSAGLSSHSTAKSSERSVRASTSRTASSKVTAPYKYEFGGPIGSLFLILSLPVLILLLYHLCPNLERNLLASSTCLRWTDVLKYLKQLPASAIGLYNSPPHFSVKGFLQDHWNLQTFLNTMLWLTLQILLSLILPGESTLGSSLKDGTRLSYPLNGQLSFWTSLLLLTRGWPTYRPASSLPFKVTNFKPFSLEHLYQHFPQYAFAATLLSLLLSLFLYAFSFLPRKHLAEGGQSGNHLYDFFIGRELNPRIGPVDLKYICELRPGLIGWVAINLGCLYAHSKSGAPFSLQLLLVCLFQGWYVVDALVHERAILTTMDITTDGFGFMLVFGDLAWVPFTYSLQARYLVGRLPTLSPPWLLAITALHLLGYIIFRGANSTKDQFRRDPTSLPHISYLNTKRGSKLMTSGWWGYARKINYTGDWLMALSWCLLCGTEHVLPYFYAVYFFILLLHRAARDDRMCAEKYGEDWERYRKQVPYVFVPALY